VSAPNAAARSAAVLVAALSVPAARDAAASAPVPCGAVTSLAVTLARCGWHDAAESLLRAHERVCDAQHAVALPERDASSVLAVDALVRCLQGPRLSGPIAQTWTCDEADRVASVLRLVNPRCRAAEDVLLAHAQVCSGRHAGCASVTDARQHIAAAQQRWPV